MRKFRYILGALLILSVTGCDKFLDSKSFTQKDLTNFPQTVEDANQMLVGIYATQNVDVRDGFYMWQLAGDDCFGGGEPGDKFMHACNRLMNCGENMCSGLWWARYFGIGRANLLFDNIDRVTNWSSEAEKNQILGEAHFLRAIYYLELVQVYGEVPVVLSSVAQNLPKSPAEEVYAVIASDLKFAIENLKSVPFTVDQAGRATKWAAEGYMARTFLFYTGFYGKTSLPLREGGEVTKNQVIEWLNDCIANSGHYLITDSEKPENGFYNLWPYTNEYSAMDWDWAKTQGVKWVGDGNPETVYAIRYSNMAGWDTPGYANNHAVHFGLRTPNGKKTTFPFGEGYGVGPVNPALVRDWKAQEPGDPRLGGSVLDVAHDFANWSWGGDLMMEETGYQQKKYLPITAYDHTVEPVTLLTTYAYLMYNTPKPDFELAANQDLILMRYPDILLMHSELTETVDGINKVRARVGLAPRAGYSFEELKQERRFELAFEAIRFNDLRRWGIAADCLQAQAKEKIMNQGNGEWITLDSNNVFYTFKDRYNETKGFFPIPQTQISLSNGVLVQTEGWGREDVEYAGW